MAYKIELRCDDGHGRPVVGGGCFSYLGCSPFIITEYAGLGDILDTSHKLATKAEAEGWKQPNGPESEWLCPACQRGRADRKTT